MAKKSYLTGKDNQDIIAALNAVMCLKGEEVSLDNVQELTSEKSLGGVYRKLGLSSKKVSISNILSVIEDGTPVGVQCDDDFILIIEVRTRKDGLYVKTLNAKRLGDKYGWVSWDRLEEHLRREAGLPIPRKFQLR